MGFVVREDAAGLTCAVYPERPLTAGEETALLERLAFFLGTREDLRPFYAAAEGDAAFRPVLDGLYGFHQPKFLTPFEAACWAVIGQRLPLTQARKIKRALMLRCGGEWEGRPAFPEPGDLLHLTEEDVLALLPNPRKARSLRELIRAFEDVTTDDLVRRPYGEVRDWLRGIYGIGQWSALFILVRGLGRLEHLGEDAAGTPLLAELLRAAAPVYGPLDPRELGWIAEGYGEEQRHWAAYLRSRSVLPPSREVAA